jgi:starvation-inducible DNA-binding protein
MIKLSLINAMKIFYASNFHLYYKTHTAHFNVSGMFFESLHTLLNNQYTDLQENIDTIGEKIRQMDVFVPGSIAWILEHSVFEEFDKVMSAKDYVTALYHDNERMIMLLEHVFDAANSENNQAIANYVSERLDAHQKNRWMLRTTLNPVKF